MTARRVSVTIDRIVIDDPSLNREEFARAIEAEIRLRLATGQSLGTPGARESAQARIEGGKRPTAGRVARAALGVITR